MSSAINGRFSEDEDFVLFTAENLLKGIPDWVAEVTEIYFFTVLKAGSPRSRCQQVEFLQRLFSLALVHEILVSLCVSTFLLLMKTVRLDWCPS